MPSQATTWTISAVLIAGTVLAAQDSKPIPAPASPGKNIQDAAQATADDLAHSGPKDRALEIVSATQGVDFRAYSQKVSTAYATPGPCRYHRTRASERAQLRLSSWC